MLNLKEYQFEADIETSLLQEGGYVRAPKTYDRELGLDPVTLFHFIETTQPEMWERYVKTYGEQAQAQLIKRFNQEVTNQGLLHVLRQGIKDRGMSFKVMYFKPETTLNPLDLERYQQNQFHCHRQFKYSLKNENSIDLVLLVNGIPLVALELKNQFTGQSVVNAKRQFREDRDPNELVFQFNRRFLVYFAVDHYEVAMTTKLEKEKTYFLPFNQGSNGAGQVGGAGNPENKEGYATAYLWEQVLTTDSLMELIRKYLHIQKEETKDPKTKKIKRKETLIFPRYHQFDVVTKLLEDVKREGSGHNYLIQHSAGSGKSNSIAWLSHRLSSLHDENNEIIFHSVIVVTDRKVLDKQLQETIYQFDHVAGVVERIDEEKRSKGLKEAIENGSRIIITTIQKFLQIYDEVGSTVGKRFAIIVDEAHSSQTGETAQKLRMALADETEALKEFARLDAEAEARYEDGEDRLIKELLLQGRHENLSFFAFTATPKPKTLQLFGTKRPDGSLTAFHHYSMRQAIEEKFILDVLKNYQTYKTSFRIAKSISENPELPSNEAIRAILRHESLHEANISQKTAIMIEQFREITQHKIGGKAKAMVVTSSRVHAYRYFTAFKAYIEKKGYPLDVLVAFSGDLIDEETGMKFKESDLNKDAKGQSISETQLPAAFHGDEFHMLVVAEKYQTGFDEPLLHTMFVDKKLSGVKAVQTLSRLNRTCRGKEDTFILDFVNTAEEIQKAFEPYYEGTTLIHEGDINLVYDLQQKLAQVHLWGEKEVNEFYQLQHKKGKQTARDLGKLSSILKPIVEGYKAMEELEREEYRLTIQRFLNVYGFTTQMIRLYDEMIHKEYLFLTYLIRFLPKNPREKVDIDDKIKLESLEFKESFHGSISLKGANEGLKPETILASTPKAKHREALDVIIDKVNRSFGDSLVDGDKEFVENFAVAMLDNKKVRSHARRSTYEMFKDSVLTSEAQKVMLECYERQKEAFEKFMQRPDLFDALTQAVGDYVYQKTQEEKETKKK